MVEVTIKEDGKLIRTLEGEWVIGSVKQSENISNVFLVGTGEPDEILMKVEEMYVTLVREFTGIEAEDERNMEIAVAAAKAILDIFEAKREVLKREKLNG